MVDVAHHKFYMIRYLFPKWLNEGTQETLTLTVQQTEY